MLHEPLETVKTQIGAAALNGGIRTRCHFRASCREVMVRQTGRGREREREREREGETETETTEIEETETGIRVEHDRKERECACVSAA